jgi:signal transduction histidine kinase
VISDSYSRLGLIEKAKYYQLKSISYLNNKQNNNSAVSSMGALFGLSGKINRYAVLGSYYITEKKPAIAEGFLKEAIALYSQLDSPMLMLDAPYLFLQMARCKTLEKNTNSASFYDTALKYMDLYQELPEGYAHYYQEKAADFFSKNLLDSSLNNINKAVKLKDSFKLGILSWYGELLTSFSKASILIKKGNARSAITLLQGEIKEIKILNNNSLLIDELSLLAKAYSANGNIKEAYRTLTEAFLLKEQLVSEQNDARSLNFEIEKKMQENEITIGILDAQNKAIQKTRYYLISIVSLLALFVLGLAVFYSNKRKSNRELALKNENLAYTIQQLKSTQAQLIQSEKMASLGELTAGIAHEIQNPLNFVNNFSELNCELINELKDATSREQRDASEEKEIIQNIKENSEKINHHGKRAESIVKGMLEHSRKSTGVKEQTDINNLCEEFVRLSYHGLRAKDKVFNCDYKLDLDPNLPLVNVVSQDIGRVILNIINNAFQSTIEKQQMLNKKSAADQSPGRNDHELGSPKSASGFGVRGNNENYSPLVVVTTRYISAHVEIHISDNGLGIPDSIKDKIFQPFFTTKPTGLGTGLGLSLSYDIVKSHGGTIHVNSDHDRGTTFIIQLPILQRF